MAIELSVSTSYRTNSDGSKATTQAMVTRRFSKKTPTGDHGINWLQPPTLVAVYTYNGRRHLKELLPTTGCIGITLARYWFRAQPTSDPSEHMACVHSTLAIEEVATSLESSCQHSAYHVTHRRQLGLEEAKGKRRRTQWFSKVNTKIE